MENSSCCWKAEDNLSLFTVHDYSDSYGTAFSPCNTIRYGCGVLQHEHLNAGSSKKYLNLLFTDSFIAVAVRTCR